MTEPTTVTDLVLRAYALAGRTLGELSRREGIEPPRDFRRAKGFVGRLMERALGLRNANDPHPDFRDLGVELKTIPLARDGSPRESTFVCRVPLSDIAKLEWVESPVRRKLARVLWVPVESDPGVPIDARRIGRALLWAPDADEEADLRADWDELVGKLGADDPLLLTAHIGRALQVRPKAANSRVLGRARDAEGVAVFVPPRGFYLRPVFTRAIFTKRRMERTVTTPA